MRRREPEHRFTHELLVEAVRILADLQAAETEEEALALLDQQVALEERIGVKLERIHAVLRKAEAEAAWLREEEERLAARRRRCTATVERCKALALDLLVAHRDLTGSDRVSTRLLTARLQASPPRLVVPEEPAAWPHGYVRRVPELDTDAIRRKLRARPDAVPGCKLVQDEHVRWA